MNMLNFSSPYIINFPIAKYNSYDRDHQLNVKNIKIIDMHKENKAKLRI